LIETYAYTRLYKNGDELKRHIDRKSCELSATLNIGGDPWPIHIDLTGGRNKVGTKIDLKPGDLLVYKGCEHEHWREVFKGKKCLQIFLHYNPKRGKNSQKYDGRPFLGIPDFDL
jgi:alkylated DNA repair dioxygenase AlkB